MNSRGILTVPVNTLSTVLAYDILFSLLDYYVILHWKPNKKRAISAAATAAKLLQSCPTLCDPIDGSPPGSPVPGILQARTLST